MTFMTYLARRTKQFSVDTKRAQTAPPTISAARHKKDVGDYWLGKTIGRGASGRVKLGIHKQTGEKVAIKMIARSHLQSSTTTAKSVQRELAVLQLLHHPHLVELKQVLQDASYVYFVMEYLEGGELFHILAEKGKFKETDARSLFYQMVSALAWCHSHHICHRDLKPENILLDKTRKRIKIADFGMAAMNTNLKTSCGSPHYASPEIVKGNAYNGTCTDVWSLGVILFALLSGHLPFDDEHMSRLLGKIKTGRYRPLPSSLSNEAKHLVKKMLVVDPNKRITMNEILCHPWLASLPSAHTPLVDPLKQWSLDVPVIQHALDLEGHIWETLKILWRDLRQEEIIQALSSQGTNLQKLTWLLLQQRTKRVEPTDKANDKHQTTASMRRTFSLNENASIQSPGLGNYNTGSMYSRHGSDDVGSKCSLATPYDSSISNVSCTRTIDMPPTPKNATFDADLATQSPIIKKKVWNRCNHALLAENGDTCMNCPQQQENAHRTSAFSAPATPSTRSRWIYREQQLTLACTDVNRHQQVAIIGDPNLERRQPSVSDPCAPLLISQSNSTCVASLHVEGDIQLQPKTRFTLSTTTAKLLPTTYNLMEQLHRQHSFPATPRSSPSLSSMLQCWWPSSITNVLTTSSTESSDRTPSIAITDKNEPPATASNPEISSTSSVLSQWWSKTVGYVLQPWIKKQPKLVTIDCHGKHECEVAGKIHQVLKEQFHGKLSGRIYPNQQIVWNGTLKPEMPTSNALVTSTKEARPSRLWFLCHMVHQHGRHFKVNLVYLQGDVTLWSQGTQQLVSSLIRYEHEANKVMMANGW